MLGDSAVLGGGGGERGGSGDAAAASAAGATHDMAALAALAGGGGGVGSNSGSDIERGRIEEGERSSFGGNRWPRQETLALLEIRSDMDVAFRDASVKGPLWEEVSRKLAELGYHRSAKKCKEKFENVYKYHKRTKDGRTGKSDGKTYRFFDQLQALDHIHNHPSTTPQPSTPSKPPQLTLPSPQPPLPRPSLSSSLVATTNAAMSIPPVTNSIPNVTVPSTTSSLPIPQGIVTIPSYPPPQNPTATNFPPSTTANPTIPTDLLSNSSTYSTSSDETLEGTSRKRKRKWKDFFERLMKEVIEKQEELQKRFLEAIEKREHERMAREEAWRAQEMQRINREREILAQERSIAAAKDAAVMSFLQKIAEQQNLPQALSNINIVPQPPPPPNVAPAPAPVVHAPPPPPPQQLPPVVQPVVVPQQQQQQQVVTNMEIVKVDNDGENFMPSASSSRWPKVEVNALIKLRTSMDAKYQENGPKGPLWEEISASMRKLGYNRNAKRCKEKWENINKYFKKVKESNKRRPEDSKTCPYFHQLDALYREKNNAANTNQVVKAESMVAPLMVRPEQQWPPQQQQQEDRRGEEDDMDEDDKDGEEDEEEDEGCGSGSGSGGSNYEIVASKPAVGASAE